MRGDQKRALDKWGATKKKSIGHISSPGFESCLYRSPVVISVTHFTFVTIHVTNQYIFSSAITSQVVWCASSENCHETLAQRCIKTESASLMLPQLWYSVGLEFQANWVMITSPGLVDYRYGSHSVKCPTPLPLNSHSFLITSHSNSEKKVQLWYDINLYLGHP